MELDKRIIEGKKPLDCFDAKDAKKAKQFVGKKGFFGGFKSQFMDLDTCPKCVLDELKEFDDFDGESPFLTSYKHCYRFFLPEEWVKEPEKKYRPYTLAEWVDQHEIGEVIHCRNEHKQEFHVMYTGYVVENGEDIQDIRTTGRIMLINMGYLLQELFERYEICVNGVWQPFGILEE